MMVLHKQQLIFLKARKVAGTSFEIALSRFGTAGDTITPISKTDEATRSNLGYPGPQNYKTKLREFLPSSTRRDIAKAAYERRLPDRYFNHMSATAVRDAVGREVWDGYKKISIVRDPWEVLRSFYHWHTRSMGTPQSLRSYVVERRHVLGWNHQQYFVGEELAVDLMLRYEHLEKDIQQLETDTPSLRGLWDVFKDLRAKGQVRPQAEARGPESDLHRMDAELDSLVRFFSAWEIDTFGYGQ